ncbi:hypothetical protein F7H86_10460 [Novacetimonas hansenii]|uniref:hypothetical protein n=1 Tax=Novacetimonas hansenii TaxID=436 RepID=UPI003C2FA30D
MKRIGRPAVTLDWRLRFFSILDRDVAMLCAWGHADTIEGTIRVRQVKTGAGLLIPVHPALEIELSAWTDCDAGTFLATERGRPFSINGFYNNFVSWCADAGLPKGCSPHGLRKAAARR